MGKEKPTLCLGGQVGFGRYDLLIAYLIYTKIISHPAPLFHTERGKIYAN